MARFDRANFLTKNIVDDIEELDLVMLNFDKLVINRPLTFYTLTALDVQRPDLLSIKIYGIQDYWWILCKYNQIDDIWNDIVPGDVIAIPDKKDIEEFYINVRGI